MGAGLSRKFRVKFSGETAAYNAWTMIGAAKEHDGRWNKLAISSPGGEEVPFFLAQDKAWAQSLVDMVLRDHLSAWQRHIPTRSWRKPRAMASCPWVGSPFSRLNTSSLPTQAVLSGITHCWRSMDSLRRKQGNVGAPTTGASLLRRVLLGRRVAEGKQARSVTSRLPHVGGGAAVASGALRLR